MPRKITADMPFDDIEDDIFETRSALKADPDAVDLLPMTDDWLPLVDRARGKDRDARIAFHDATAARVVANHRLDDACTAFGDELYLAVKKDTTAPRWIQFFHTTVSTFVRQRLDKQTAKVRSWLDAKLDDAVLDKHRPRLDTWNTAAENALKQTNAVALVRGTARVAREQMAEDLTRERDGLHEALAQRARERGLGRDWPNLFFRTETRPRKDAKPEEPTPPPANG
jgi:hypothetical protein